MSTNNTKQKNISNGWRLAKIGDIGDIVSGGTPSTEVLEYWGGEIPWITPTEITKLKTKYIFDTERKITKLGLEKSSAKEIPPMSLIICSRATVGKCAINRNLVTTNQGFKNIIPNKNINIYFLYYYIYTQSNQLKRISSGSTFLEFSKFDLEKFKFLLPPLPEQNKIVQILETWDEYLEKITKKIEIKKSAKKGLMHKLLSGEIRLKGFSEERKEKKIEDVADIKKGQGLSKGALSSSGKNKCILYGEIYTTYNEVVTSVVSRTDDSDGIKSVKNDVLIPASTTTSAMDLATATVVLEDNVLLGGDINIIRDKKNNFNGIYLSYYLTHIKKYELARLAQGITIVHLYGKDFKKISIELPSIKEQDTIADIITTADLEIKYLENKKKIIEDQKRYLLNNLVTGKIRIPEFQKVK